MTITPIRTSTDIAKELAELLSSPPMSVRIAREVGEKVDAEDAGLKKPNMLPRDWRQLSSLLYDYENAKVREEIAMPPATPIESGSKRLLK